MKKMHGASYLKSIFLLMLGSFLVVACSAPKGNSTNGKRWYMMNNCFACHGLNGDDGKGPEIRGINISYRSFISTVRDANSPIMPKYPESKIPDQEVADIFAWLQAK